MTFISLGGLSIPISLTLLVISLVIGLVVLLIAIKKHRGFSIKAVRNGGITALGTYAVFSIVIGAARSHAVLPTTAYMQLNGESISITELSRSRPIVVNLWSTGCEPCRNLMPILQDAEQRYSNVAFVSLNQREPSQLVSDFMRLEGFSFKHILLDNSAEIATNKGIFSLPATLFYSPTGELVYSHNGVMTAQELDASIKQHF